MIFDNKTEPFIIGSLIANAILMYYTFILAYLNNYEILIKINEYGEAHIELILLTIILITSITIMIKSMKKVK